MNLSTGEWRQVKRIFEALLDVPAEEINAELEAKCEAVPHLKPVVQGMIDVHQKTADQSLISRLPAIGGMAKLQRVSESVMSKQVKGTQQHNGLSQQRWQSLLASMDLSDAADVFADLNKAYAEKHRHYHTAEHINAMLKHLDACKEQLVNPHEVELAIWFHDAIYRPYSASNEADSAAWAADFLRQQGHADDSIQRVHELIMATVHNGKTSATDQRWLVDIDLSILGTRPEVYDEYEQQVRREYRWVPGFMFRKKRAALLRSLLQQRPIYHTPFFQDRYEAAARANLERAIKALTH